MGVGQLVNLKQNLEFPNRTKASTNLISGQIVRELLSSVFIKGYHFASFIMFAQVVFVLYRMAIGR